MAKTMLTKFILAKLVPYLSGSPGCGKSDLAEQVAEHYNLLLIDVRLSQCDVTDLNGFPRIDGNKSGYVPMDTFPLEGDPLPMNPKTGKLYTGWLILFDEISSAPPSLQAASYKIILDRKIGQIKLHKNVAIMCAGNKETDNAVVFPMSTALQSRLVHLELVVDHKEWIDWANEHDIDHRITSFIGFKPGALYTFQADHTDNTYACPRTWAFADKVLKVTDINAPECLPMLAGTLSEGVAREFIGYCKVFTELPTMAQIMDTPDSIRVPVESSVLFALTGAIAHHATADNVGALLKFVVRLPIEFQVITVKQAIKRTSSLMANAAVQEWINKHAGVYMH